MRGPRELSKKSPFHDSSLTTSSNKRPADPSATGLIRLKNGTRILLLWATLPPHPSESLQPTKPTIDRLRRRGDHGPDSLFLVPPITVAVSGCASTIE